MKKAKKSNTKHTKTNVKKNVWIFHLVFQFREFIWCHCLNGDEKAKRLKLLAIHIEYAEVFQYNALSLLSKTDGVFHNDPE